MRKLFWCLTFIALISISNGIVLASTGGEYDSTITISNNSTSTTNVFVPFTLSTSDMITASMLNATATDAAVQKSGGTDVAFMPGWSTNPWVTFVPSIGTGSQVIQHLFSKGATGGTIRYYPGTGGFQTADSPTLELGNSFTLEQKGYLDTTAGATKNLVYKADAIKVYVDPSTSGTITVAIPGLEASQISCTTGDVEYRAFGGTEWWYQTFLTTNAFTLTKFNLKLADLGTPGTVTVSLRAESGNKPTGADLTSGTTNGETLGGDPGSWRDIDVTDYDLAAATEYAIVVRCSGGADQLGWRDDNTPTYVNDGYSNDSGGTWTTQGNGMMFKVYGYTLETVTATGISSGEKTLKVVQAEDVSVSFDKIDDEIIVTDVAAIRDMAVFTIEAWAYPISVGENNGGRIVDKGGGDLMLLLYPASGIELKRTRVTTACDVYNGTGLTLNDWNYVVATYNGTAAFIYKNAGSLSLTGNVGSGALVSDAGDLYIGNQVGEARTWDGKLGNIRIYSRVLGQAEITANYALGRSGAPTNTADLKVYLKLNEGTGTTATDSSGNGNTGTLTNGPAWVNKSLSIYDGTTLLAQGGTGCPSVLNNTNSYTFLQNNSMPYMEYQKITIGGTQQQWVYWEYAANFTDHSPSGSHPTTSTTFRTASSDADVSASISSQVGTGTATSPTSASTGGATMIPNTAPPAPAHLFTEGSDSYPMGDKVHAWANDAGDPPEVYDYLICYGLTILFFIMTFGAMQSTKLGRRGSLFIATLGGLTPQILFMETGTIQGFMLIPYGIILGALILWAKSPSPVD